MKKLFSIVLIVAMLVSILSTTVSSAGTIIFEDNFDTGFSSRYWLNDPEGCKFQWDKYNGCIHGYQPARVLQSNFLKKYDKQWAQFYGKFDVQFRAFDDIEDMYNGKPHDFTIWYHDLFENSEDESLPQGALYLFSVEAETGKAYLTKEITYKYYDVNGNRQENTVNTVIAEGDVGHPLEVGEFAPWYEIGIRVISGKIEGYVDQKLVLSAEASDADEKIGHISLNNVDSTVGSQKSPFIIYNGERESASWLALDNFEIWSPDYDFNPSPVYVYGDVNGDGNVNLSDISMMLQAIAKWELEGYTAEAGDVNGDGAVNLSDVSKTLQAIAKWEGVVLGPTA